MSKQEPSLDAIRSVVAHYWRNEQKHFVEFVTQGGEPQKHIFASLQLLRDWIQLGDATWKPLSAVVANVVKKIKPTEEEQ